jgi:hypothetical protein
MYPTMNHMMGLELVLVLLFVCVGIVIAIFYILTLSRALEKCSPQSRTMQPGMLWLLLIPFVNLVWQFFVVMALSNSLGNEFRARGMANAPQEPGKQLGLAMCVCGVCAIIPFVGALAGLANIVLWIMYWVKMTEFSRMLDLPPVVGMQMGGVPPGGVMPGV